MTMIIDFKRLVDEHGVHWVMCPLCFELNETISARDGGRLSTSEGDVWDVCVRCAAMEFLQGMIRWCA